LAGIAIIANREARACEVSGPVGAGFGVDALVCEAEPLDWTAVDEVFLDDLLGILRLYVAIPDGLRVDDDGWAMLALVEAAGLVDANRATEAGGLGKLLQLGVQFALSVGGARGARGAFRTGVVAYEDVVLENWQTIPPASRLQASGEGNGAENFLRRTFHILLLA
jgi:hypothetical protein